MGAIPAQGDGTTGLFTKDGDRDLNNRGNQPIPVYISSTLCAASMS